MYPYMQIYVKIPGNWADLKNVFTCFEYEDHTYSYSKHLSLEKEDGLFKETLDCIQMLHTGVKNVQNVLL